MKKAFFNISCIVKYIIVVLIIFYQAEHILAQRNLKYKDVYKVINEKSKEEAYSLLLVYQKQEPYFPNTYFQLGLISQYWSKDYDALTNLRDVEFFIYNTGLYFGLAKSKIDAKEIRKNDKYYMNVERFKKIEKLEETEVIAFIDEQIAANNEYKKNVYLVTRLFNSSVKHYSSCINIFKEINTNNNKIKDIYLMAGDKFNKQLNELESSFDSTIYYLQNYQTAIKNYPIKDYDQEYKLLPIETYRLHGLTGSDFLQNEIPIWNYGKWVKEVKEIINGDISKLRQSIEKADNLLNKNTNFLLETNQYNEEFNLQKIDPRIKYKIGKYDFNSILLKLFNYKESKVDFLTWIRNPINNINDSLMSYSLIQKARYYESLVQKKLICDSLIKNFTENINAYDLNKYNAFFNNKYGGETGLKNYAQNEESLLFSQLNNSFNNFKNYLVKPNNNTNYDSVLYKNKVIKFKRVQPDFENFSQGEYYTVDFRKSPSGDYYITGYTRQRTNFAQSFVAKIDFDGKVDWLKVLPLNMSGPSTGSYIMLQESGFEVLFTLVGKTLTTSQIISFDEKGKQKGKYKLVPSGFPRYLNYDEINQKYLLGFKGSNPDQFKCLDEELVIAQIDASSKSLNWQTKLKVKGQFVDILKMNEEFFVFTNFSTYKSNTNNLSSQGKTNTLMIVLDKEGNITKEKALLNKNSYFINKAIKLSSNTINLVGFKNQLMNIEDATIDLGEFLYMLINSKGEVYFDNWK